jgi:hypothetical protein
MTKIITVGKRSWTDLESRLAASIIYRVLRDHPDRTMTREALLEACGSAVDLQTLLHAIVWMRTHGVDLQVVSPRTREEVSQLRLVIP